MVSDLPLSNYYWERVLRNSIWVYVISHDLIRIIKETVLIIKFMPNSRL